MGRKKEKVFPKSNPDSVKPNTEAPFIPFNNNPVKIRKQELQGTKEFHDHDIMFKLIQGCGRCTRYDDDFSITYVIDSGCEKIFKDIYNYRQENPGENNEWYNDALKCNLCNKKILNGVCTEHGLIK